jgi:hypothetical protein
VIEGFDAPEVGMKAASSTYRPWTVCDWQFPSSTDAPGSRPARSAPCVADVQDWCYLDREGNLLGGFTVELVREAARRQFEAQASEAT